MNPYTYHTFTHQLPIGAQFRQGQTDGKVWLVGAETRTQINELMRRMEKLLANPQAPTLAQIEQVQNEFEVWYRAEFQKVKHKEYAEQQGSIVQSLGVVWADSAGRVTLFRQSFQFCQIRTDEQLVPFNDEYETIQLIPGMQLLAHPDPDDKIAQKVRDRLKAANGEWATLEATTFTQPIAMLRVEQEELPTPDLPPVVNAPLIQTQPFLVKREPINWQRYALPTASVLALAVILFLGYIFRDNLSELLNRKPAPKQELVTDPKSTQPASPTVTNQDDRKPIPNLSEQQLTLARQTFALAEFFRKQGKPDPARKRYQLARKQFEESCQKQPTFCREADSSLAVIEVNLQLLNSESEF